MSTAELAACLGTFALIFAAYIAAHVQWMREDRGRR